MKIYTKTGDKGSTSLIGGKRVPKFHARIEAYGTVDELISYIGLLRSDAKMADGPKKDLISIQDKLMTCASILASDCEDCKVKIPVISEEDIVLLENKIDSMHDNLPALKSFILPGGDEYVSFCHIARTVCRKAERLTIKLSQELMVDENVLKYLNRLSDYLFVFARKISNDKNIEEIPWQPKLE